MNKNKVTELVQSRLFELQDTEYRDFHARLMPTVEKEKIIGVRTPILRKFAKEFARTEDAVGFMKASRTMKRVSARWIFSFLMWIIGLPAI